MADVPNGNGKAWTLIGLAKESIVGAALIGMVWMFLGHLERADERAALSYEKLSTSLQSIDSGIRRLIDKMERSDGK